MCIKKHVIQYSDIENSNPTVIYESSLTFEVVADRIVVHLKRKSKGFVASIPLDGAFVVCDDHQIKLVASDQAANNKHSDELIINFDDIGLSMSNCRLKDCMSLPHGSLEVVEWVYAAQKHRNALPMMLMRYLSGHSSRPRSVGSALFRLGGLVVLGFIVLIGIQMFSLSPDGHAVINNNEKANHGMMLQIAPEGVIERPENPASAADVAQPIKPRVSLDDVRNKIESEIRERESNHARLGGLSEGDGHTMESWEPGSMETVTP